MVVISICIPTFNSSKHIIECINSVLNQSYSDFEIIISDNNSTDNTIDLIKSINSKKITLYQNKSNIGMAENFIKVCELANGKFIKLLASDDVLEPKALEKSINTFKDNPNLSLVVTSKKLINNNSKTIIKNFSSLKDGRYESKFILKKIIKSGRNPIGEPSFSIFKKIDYFNVGGFDKKQSLFLDLDLWFRLLKIGDLYFLNTPLGGFRIQPESNSVRNSGFKSYISWLKMIEENGVNKFIKIYVKFKIYFFIILKNIFYKVYLKN